MDQQQLISAISQNFRELENNSIHTVYKDEQGTNRILIGRRSDGSYGIDVSQTGNDVTEAAANKLIMSSNFNMFKVVATSTFNLAMLDAAGGANDVRVDIHDTGYSSNDPLAFQAFVVDQTGGYSPFPIFYHNYSGLLQLTRSIRSYVDAGTVKLRVDSQNFTGMAVAASQMRYYLFAESAS
jgi:hypothetical protein